jgi:Rod binding domain-containing protein
MDVQFPTAAISSALTKAGTRAAVPLEHAEESFQHLFAKASSDDKKLADTAKQFEAVMAGEVLKAARGSSQGGWLGLNDGEDDQTGEMTVELAEQGLAQGLASTGAFGIAKMVVAQLSRHQSNQPKETSSAPATDQ